MIFLQCSRFWTKFVKSDATAADVKAIFGCKQKAKPYFSPKLVKSDAPAAPPRGILKSCKKEMYPEGGGTRGNNVPGGGRIPWKCT